MRTESIGSETRLAILSAGVLGGLAALVTVAKPGHAALLPPCPLHALTGFFCPGCGTTRALYLLVHGHPLAAFGENAISVLLLPFLLYELGATLTHRWRPLSPRFAPRTLWIFLAIVLVFAVLRNLPFFPFSMLAPTDLP